MIYRLLTLFTTITLLAATSCKKAQETPDNTITYNNIMIGCKQGQPITVAIDPLNSGSFAYTASLCDVVITGPSCLSNDKKYYYTASADDNIAEIEISKGSVIRTFHAPGHPISLHYAPSENKIIYLLPQNYDNSYSVNSLDLATEQSTQLFNFKSDYGFAVRTSFMANNGNLYFMNGMGELMKIDLISQTCTKAAKLSSVCNAVVYDKITEQVYYLASPNHKDFSLYRYDFASGTDMLLKDYPDIKTMLLSSVVFDQATKNIYLYDDHNDRIAINTQSLDHTITPVTYSIINTEIVSCTIRKPEN